MGGFNALVVVGCDDLVAGRHVWVGDEDIRLRSLVKAGYLVPVTPRAATTATVVGDLGPELIVPLVKAPRKRKPKVEVDDGQSESEQAESDSDSSG